MEVKGNHPLAEVIACKLFSITTVPKQEAERMVNRACKAAVEWHERMVLDARIEEQELVKSLGSLNTHPTAVAMKRLEELRSERNLI